MFPGIQTQTAECLVIGELTCDVLVVVLNKVDLFPEKTRAQSVEKVTTKLRKVFAQTKCVVIFAGELLDSRLTLPVYF